MKTGTSLAKRESTALGIPERPSQSARGLLATPQGAVACELEPTGVDADGAHYELRITNGTSSPLAARATAVRLDDEARPVAAIAVEIEKGPPLAFAQIKRAVYGSWGELEEALRREREGQLKLLRSQDAMEGIMAWAQKREPGIEGARIEAAPAGAGPSLLHPVAHRAGIWTPARLGGGAHSPRALAKAPNLPARGACE